MGQLLLLAGLGMALGFKHALDADHVVAVSAMVAQSRRLSRSVWLGVHWGLGHTAALLAAAGLMLTFRVALPLHAVRLLEAGVGAVLILLGIDVLRRLRSQQLHAHVHAHGSGEAAVTHWHWHAHAGNPGHRHEHRSFAVGLLHGLAGSGPLTLLVAASVPNLAQGLAFTAVFGVGSILGMTIVSAVIAVPFLVSRRAEAWHRAVQAAAGGGSVLLGCLLLAANFLR